MISGLPGTGKSFFARNLAKQLPFTIVESDAVRKNLFPVPKYTAAESASVFIMCHTLILELLKSGFPVIFDATNLNERNRQVLYHIGASSGARLFLVSVEAPSEVVNQRLQMRKASAYAGEMSDADWQVYLKLKGIAERIRRNHFVVDTSKDITLVIDRLVRAICKNR